MELLECKDLCKSFDNRVILDNVIHNAAISLIKYLKTDDKEAFSRDLSI